MAQTPALIRNGPAIVGCNWLALPVGFAPIAMADRNQGRFELLAVTDVVGA